MLSRIETEAHLLASTFLGLELKLPWLRLKEYQMPSQLWVPEVVEVAFSFPDQYPQCAPYGFYVRPAPQLRGGGAPANTQLSSDPPFGGAAWLKFSWQPAEWVPGSCPSGGSNIVQFAHSIRARLMEGR